MKFNRMWIEKKLLWKRTETSETNVTDAVENVNRSVKIKTILRALIINTSSIYSI